MGEKGSFLKGGTCSTDVNLPSGYVKIAIKNDPSIVDSPIRHGDF